MKFHYTTVSTFNTCPYQYKLRYLDGFETLDDYSPTDALKLGTALHIGIEEGVKEGLKAYHMAYPISSDLHINEAIKLEHMIKKVRDSLPLNEKSFFEVNLENDFYKGAIDMLVKNEDGSYDMYDFKYSNNIDRYMESPQLHIYKYYAEKLLGIKVRKMYFVFAQKVMIRQKKSENLHQFRQRLRETLKDAKVTIKEVSYDANKVIEFATKQVEILQCTDYKNTPNKLCDWCEFQNYCEKGDDLDMLPSTSRVEIQKDSHKKLWIYGQPFSGKTVFADKSPTPINLNTDGNVKYVSMPRLAIKDELISEGRITTRKFAWETFIEAVDELEKGSEFETIVVDLLEDVFDYCRVKVCDDNDWTHESDDSFKAYEITRNEFLRTMKRLVNLPYNIILLSHEDTSIDIMKKGGDKVTAIRPNINEKVAKKIAGMVDLVARLVVDDGERTLTFKSDEIIFGGGRLKGLKTAECPCEWDAVCKVYEEAIGNAKDKTEHQKKVEEYVAQQESEPTPADEPAEIPAENEQPKRRTRRSRA